MELRKSGRTKLLDEEDWDALPVDAQGLSFEEKELIGSALKLFAETERRIVILHAASGLKHREIAKQLDIPLPTVLSKYARAIKKLKNIWKETTRMNERESENRLKAAIEKTAPNDFSGVLSRVSDEKGLKVMTMKKNYSQIIRRVGAESDA